MADDPFDSRALRDWWKNADGKPFRDEMRNQFSAAISDLRKDVLNQKFYEAYGHAVEARTYEDVLQMVDGLIQDHVNALKDEEPQKGKKSK